jgi:uncharacterized protein (TIGR00369 family)
VRLPPPVADLLGIELVEAGGGECTMRLEAGEQHSNPMGTIHGGILCDIADAAMGMAFFSTLDEGESFTTLELKINFVRPFWTGTLLAHGKVISRGKTVGLTECRVVDAEERLIAHGTSTVMALRGVAAEGR